MDTIMTSGPGRRRLRAVLFRLFRRPYAVGFAPYSCEPEWELSFRAGHAPPSVRDIHKVLRSIPDLESELLERLGALVGEVLSASITLGRLLEERRLRVRITLGESRVHVEVRDGRTAPNDGQALISGDGLGVLAGRWGLRDDGQGRLWTAFDRKAEGVNGPD